MKEVKDNIDIDDAHSVILFATAHCNPCKNMRKIIENLEASHSDKAKFYYLNTEKNESLSKKYSIKSVPTIVFKKGNVVKDRFAGFIDNVDLENKLMNLLFDFDEEMNDFNDFSF
ncbi:MAG: thioredoxin family protein [Flavobacteriales bacterium]|nr:thioredoxin family protein [Flavobacteriales bacterium]